MDYKACRVCQNVVAITEFYPKESRCKSCAKEYTRAWQKANPDKVKKYDKKKSKKQWQVQKNDPEYILKKKIYHKETSARRVALAKAWNEDNPEKYKRNVAKSQMKRKISKDAKSYKILDKELFKLRHSPCAFCNTTENITIDHIIPISRNGAHSIGNLQSLCKSCNSKKKAKFISEYKYHLFKLTSPAK